MVGQRPLKASILVQVQAGHPVTSIVEAKYRLFIRIVAAKARKRAVAKLPRTLRLARMSADRAALRCDSDTQPKAGDAKQGSARE
jgi:hypothetical protein